MVYGSGGSSGPQGAGGGGWGHPVGSYGYGGSSHGPSHLPGGVGRGGGKRWDYSMTILAIVVVAILIGVVITTIIWLDEGPDHEKVDQVEASSFVNGTVSCEAKLTNSQATGGRDCRDYHWDGASPLTVYVTLDGFSGVDWADCAGYFANADGSKEEKAQSTATSTSMVFMRPTGPNDLIADEFQLKIRCSGGYHFANPSRLAARFRFAIGRA